MTSQQSSALVQANSFHPTLLTNVEVFEIDTCGLHIYYALPPLIFIDPYELANYRSSYSFQHIEPSNLELPPAALEQSGSSLLLTVSVPRRGGTIDAEVPLHVRYGTTSANRSLALFQTAELQSPYVLLSCPQSLPHKDTVTVPAEFQQLFNPAVSRIVPIAPHAPDSVGIVHTPIGIADDLAVVEIGTATIIALSFCYLLNAMLR
ncbi:PIG-X, partial [Mycena vulgaris]